MIAGDPCAQWSYYTIFLFAIPLQGRWYNSGFLEFVRTVGSVPTGIQTATQHGRAPSSSLPSPRKSLARLPACALSPHQPRSPPSARWPRSPGSWSTSHLELFRRRLRGSVQDPIKSTGQTSSAVGHTLRRTLRGDSGVLNEILRAICSGKLV